MEQLLLIIILLLCSISTCSCQYYDVDLDEQERFTEDSRTLSIDGRPRSFIFQVRKPNWNNKPRCQALTLYPCAKLFTGVYIIRLFTNSTQYISSSTVNHGLRSRVIVNDHETQWKVHSTQSVDGRHPILIQNTVKTSKRGVLRRFRSAMWVVAEERSICPYFRTNWRTKMSLSYNRHLFTEWVPWCNGNGAVYLQVLGVNKWLHRSSRSSTTLQLKDSLHQATALEFIPLSELDHKQ